MHMGQCAQDSLRASNLPGETAMPPTPDTDVAGPYEGTGNDNEWGEEHVNILCRIMATDYNGMCEH